MGMTTVDRIFFILLVFGSPSDFHPENDDTWDIETEEEEEVAVKDDEQLTMLVRQSYLRHLEKCLMKNYSDSTNGRQPLAPAQMSEMIALHAKQLEKKALRTSMRVGIYQRCMIREIEEVKRATKRSQIHSAFTPGKVRRKDSTDRETQTEEVRATDSFSAMLSSAFGVSPGPVGQVGGAEGIDSYEELLNILTDSPEPPPVPEEADRPDLDARLKQLGLWEEDNGDEVTLNGTFGEEPPDPSPHPRYQILPPTDWADELRLQTDLVNTILRRLSPNKRYVIERRFRDLFGAEWEPPPTLPVVEVLSEARRQLASFVVKALTPFYSQGRIGTRIVFKSLAKRITDRLLEKHTHPDPALAKREVKICFALKPEIVSTRDVDQLFVTLGS